MMKMLHLLFLLILCLDVCYAQVMRPGPYNTLVLSNSFTDVGAEFWGSGGASLAHHEPVAGWLSPAAMSPRRQIYAEFGRTSQTQWLADIHLNGRVCPTFAGIIMPIRRGAIGLGYANYYDLLVDYSSIEVTTINNPDGTGEFMHAQDRISNHAIFVAANYPLHDSIILGANVGANIIHHRSEIWNTDIAGTGAGLTATVGLLIRPIRQLDLLCNAKYVADIDYDYKYKDRPITFLQADVDPAIHENNERVAPTVRAPDSFPYHADYPWSIDVTAIWRMLPKITLSAAMEFENWSESDADADVQNVLNLHAGSFFAVTKSVNIGLGFVTQNEHTKPSPFNTFYADQQFLTAGVGITIGRLVRCSIAYMDARIFNTEKTREDILQTRMFGGLTFVF